MIRWQGRYTKRNKGGHKKIQYQEETKMLENEQEQDDVKFNTLQK